MADYEKIYINNNEAKFREAFDHLVTIGLADHTELTWSSNKPILNIYDEDNNSMFTITNYTTFVGRNADGETVEVPHPEGYTWDGYFSNYSLQSAYLCNNGMILNVKGTLYATGNCLSHWIMFTGNNVMKASGGTTPVMIGCGPASNQGVADGSVIRAAMNTQYVSCWTDDSPMNTIPAAAPTVTNQCILIPFFTTAKVDEVSYTPYAGRFMTSNMNQFINDYDIHVVTFNHARWLTNGYWALQL